MMQGIHSSKTLVLTRATGHNIPEDGILEVDHIHKMLFDVYGLWILNQNDYYFVIFLPYN
jgi:hypothetical protein